MSAASRPVVYGEVLFDRFPDGSTVLGGAPFNVAWHLQAFGRRPLFISRVGNDALGRDIRHWMQEWDMDSAGLQLDSAHPTGTVTVNFGAGGEPRFDIVNDCAYDYIDAGVVPPVTPALFYHGTLILRNSGSAASLAMLRNKLGKPVFLDVNLRAPWWNRDTVAASLDGADIVKLNEDELVLLLPEGAAPGDGARHLMQRHGIGRLIITRGARGAVAMDRDGTSLEIDPGAAAPQVIDTVGAGDAFASIVILGNLLGWPLQITMQRAQQFASAIVSVRGAVVRDRDFYQPFINDWNLTAS